MNAKTTLGAILVAAALTAPAATVASADSGPGPGQGARQQREQLRQALQQRQTNLQERIRQREAKLMQALQQRAQARGSAAQRLAARGGVHYRFVGHLTAVSSATVSLSVEAGNHAALVKLAGESADQSFAIGSGTEFLAWTDGVPKVVDASALKTGDWVAVNVRAPRAAGLDRIESAPAAIVSDLGASVSPPDEPLYLFRGKLQSTGSSSVTVAVRGGNDRALRLLVGTDDTQSFAVGPETIFLLWQGKVPTVVTLADLKPGDSVTVRIRAKAGSDLKTVISTPAKHVGEHEPANAQSGV